MDEVRRTILEGKEGNEVYHITCEGVPIDSFESEDEANKHLNIYKDKHPKKEFIIEKQKYNSHSDMIDKLDEMGETFEEKKTKTMEKNPVKVKNLAQAILDAKEKGHSKIKVGTESYDVNEYYKQLEEKEMCDEYENMNEESDMEESNAFVLAADAAKDAGEKEFEFPKGSGKMHKVTIKADIDMKEGKNRMYYHVLEDGGYGRIGHQGYYNTEAEAQKRANDLSDMFPKSEFYVEAYPSKKEPVTVTMEGEIGKDETLAGKSECSECGTMLNEEGQCNECSTMREEDDTIITSLDQIEEEDSIITSLDQLDESKKLTLRLTESELVSLISRMVSESVPGIEVTKRAQKTSGEDSKTHMSDVKNKLKKVSTFDGNNNPEFPNQITKGDKVAHRTTEGENETIEDNRGGGLEDLSYDYEPSEKFKIRLKKALEGDSTMGNSQNAANVIPSKTGTNISKKVERKAQKLAGEKQVSWGHRGIEPLNVKTVNESKTTMSSVLEEEVQRMKNILGYNEKTQ